MTENVTAKIRYSFKGTTAAHKIDERSSERSQKNDLKKTSRFISKMAKPMLSYPEIMMMIRIGSFVTTRQKMAKAGPKEIRVQPINSANVMMPDSVLEELQTKNWWNKPVTDGRCCQLYNHQKN